MRSVQDKRQGVGVLPTLNSQATAETERERETRLQPMREGVAEQKEARLQQM